MPADPKPVSSQKRKLTSAEVDERKAFKPMVLRLDRGCVFHDDPWDCRGPLQAHHVIRQQDLRKRGWHHLLWDPRNGVTLCRRAHEQHTSRFRPLPLFCLPERCVVFASELGMGDYLRRFYG